MKIAKLQFVTSKEIKIARQDNKWRELLRSVVRRDSLVFPAEVCFLFLGWLLQIIQSLTKATTRESFNRVHPWIFYLTTYSFCSLEQGLKEPLKHVGDCVYFNHWFCTFEKQAIHFSSTVQRTKSCVTCVILTHEFILCHHYDNVIHIYKWLTKCDSLTWVYTIQTFLKIPDWARFCQCVERRLVK